MSSRVTKTRIRKMARHFRRTVMLPMQGQEDPLLLMAAEAEGYFTRQFSINVAKEAAKSVVKWPDQKRRKK